jgi:hypothetical protein
MPLFYQNITGVVLNLITFVIILLPLPQVGGRTPPRVKDWLIKQRVFLEKSPPKIIPKMVVNNPWHF